MYKYRFCFVKVSCLASACTRLSAQKLITRCRAKYVVMLFLLANITFSSLVAEASDPPLQIFPEAEIIVPLGSTDDFSWEELPDAIDYDLFVYSYKERAIVFRDRRIDPSHCAEKVCQTDAVQTQALEAGRYSWRISARTIDGRTAFSRVEFTVMGQLPSIPVLVSPSANSEFTPSEQLSLTWERDPDSLGYKLYVYNLSSREIVYKIAGYSALDCAVEMCNVELPLGVISEYGSYSWRVSAFNGSGQSDYSRSEFVVLPTLLQQPEPVSPVGSTRVEDGEDIVFTWQASEGANSYDLMVWSQDTESVIYRQTNIVGTTACEETFCEHILSETTLSLPNGDYVWHVSAIAGAKRSSFSQVQWSVEPGNPPNIVYLMADDLGFADLNPTDMPSSYAIAQQYGVTLPFFTYQNCAPTRTALMTGNRSASMGVTGVDPPPSYAGLPVDQVLISEILQDAGYRTGIFGKWHLGLDYSQSPLFNGFDEFVGFTHGWINSYGPSPDGEAYPDGTIGHGHHGSHDFQRFGVPSYESEYSTFVFRDAAIEFINSATVDDSPYFLYVPFNAPHGPYSAPREFVEPLKERFGVTKGQMNLLYEYADEVLGKPKGLAQPDGSPYSFALNKKLDLMLYYASVRALDEAVADILNSIIENGDLNNTFFMFASDNGATLSRGGFGSNAPFSEGKGSFLNGGHRVANFAIFPEQYGIQGPLETNVWVGDLYATFSQIAGLDSSINLASGIDSTGLLPALINNIALPIRVNGTFEGGTHFVVHEAKGYDSRRDDTVTYEWSVIDGSYKYVRAGEMSIEGEFLTLQEFLYDFNSDIAESANLVSNAAASSRLNAMRSIYMQEGGDAMIQGWHTTDKSADWSNGIPEEWGFP